MKKFLIIIALLFSATLKAQTYGTAGISWGLNGNRILDRNYIGTNNLAPLNFKTSGILSGYFDTDQSLYLLNVPNLISPDSVLTIKNGQVRKSLYTGGGGSKDILRNGLNQSYTGYGELGGSLIRNTTLTSDFFLHMKDGTLKIGDTSRDNTNLLELILNTDSLDIYPSGRGGYIQFSGSTPFSNDGGNIYRGSTPSVGTRLILSDYPSKVNAQNYNIALGIKKAFGQNNSMWLSSYGGFQFYSSANDNLSVTPAMQLSHNNMELNERLKIGAGSYNLNSTTSDSSAISIYSQRLNAANFGWRPSLNFGQTLKLYATAASPYNGSPTPNKPYKIDTVAGGSSVPINIGQTVSPFSKSLGVKIVLQDLANTSAPTVQSYVRGPGDTTQIYTSLGMTDIAFGTNGEYSGLTMDQNYGQVWLTLPRNDYKDMFSIFGGGKHERFRFTGGGGLIINNSLDSVIVNDSIPLSIISDKAMLIPKGTTAQRPISPTSGYLRFNTDLGSIEVYNGTKWLASPTQSAIPNPTGGAVVDVEARAAIVSILTVMRTLNLIAP